MFSRSETHLHAGATTLISRSSHIKGDLHFAGHLEIEGEVTGNVIADNDKAHMRLQESGKVIGKVNAPSIIINGTVEGDVLATKHLELAANARVKGNIYYRSLEVVKGAQVDGKMVHQDPKQKEQKQEEAKPPAEKEKKAGEAAASKE